MSLLDPSTWAIFNKPTKPSSQGATATPLPPKPATVDTKGDYSIPVESDESPAGGRRKRRSRRRGGFVLQNPNLKAGAPPTGAAGTLGGRRTRKHKGKGKKHTRRH
jgi:hypothetical protein